MLAAAVLAAAAAFMLSPASLGEMLIRRYTKLHMPPAAADRIEVMKDGRLAVAEFLRAQSDPMAGIDTSVMIYRAGAGAMLQISPGEAVFAAPGGQLLMFRGMLGELFKMQGPSRDVYYAKSLDGFEFVEERACGLTDTVNIPEGCAAYTVSYGDRVLRYAPELMLEDNAAYVVPLGETVYVLQERGAMFRVALPDGRCGYFNSECLEPARPQGADCDPPVVDAGNTTYGYYEMMGDVSELLEKYPDALHLVEIGRSAAGNGIPVLLLGDPGAPRKMLVQASIHAREYPTTLILMKQLETLLDGLSQGPSDELPADTALIIIPMSNPDGAMLAMAGDALVGAAYRGFIRETGGNASAWKSNLNGVDLNRNFDANWDKIERGVTEPRGERFMGYRPDSEPETQLLKKYTDLESVVATVSYHTCGGVIYWWYYQGGRLLKYSESLAEAAMGYTGYGMVGRRGSYGSHGGLKDYGVTLGKPGITIEFGRGGNPITYEETQKALADSEGLLAGLAQWMREKYPIR